MHPGHSPSASSRKKGTFTFCVVRTQVEGVFKICAVSAVVLDSVVVGSTYKLGRDLYIFFVEIFFRTDRLCVKLREPYFSCEVNSCCSNKHVGVQSLGPEKQRPGPTEETGRKRGLEDVQRRR